MVSQCTNPLSIFTQSRCLCRTATGSMEVGYGTEPDPREKQGLQSRAGPDTGWKMHKLQLAKQQLPAAFVATGLIGRVALHCVFEVPLGTAWYTSLQASRTCHIVVRCACHVALLSRLRALRDRAAKHCLCLQIHLSCILCVSLLNELAVGSVIAMYPAGSS